MSTVTPALIAAASVPAPAPVPATHADIQRAVKLIALAGCVKPKLLGDAKAALSEPSSHNVNFRAHVRGIVSKGMSTPAGNVLKAVTVDVFTRGVICRALRMLKVRPARLRAAVQAAAKEGWGLTSVDKVDDCGDLSAIFDEVSAEISGELAPTTIETAGRAAAVRVEAMFELLD